MSRVQQKRRKKREKGSASYKSVICAVLGFAEAVFILYAVRRAAGGTMTHLISGLSMVFFFSSIIELSLGIRFAKIPGHSIASRVTGIVGPAVALAGFMALYLAGIFSLL